MRSKHSTLRIHFRTKGPLPARRDLHWIYRGGHAPWLTLPGTAVFPPKHTLSGAAPALSHLKVISPLLTETWRFTLRGRMAIHCYSGGHRWNGRWDGREKKEEESGRCGRCCGLVANWTECRDSVCELGFPGSVETCACGTGGG